MKVTLIPSEKGSMLLTQGRWYRILKEEYNTHYTIINNLGKRYAYPKKDFLTEKEYRRIRITEILR